MKQFEDSTTKVIRTGTVISRGLNNAVVMKRQTPKKITVEDILEAALKMMNENLSILKRGDRK